MEDNEQFEHGSLILFLIALRETTPARLFQPFYTKRETLNI
jgi:hypothetical protein